MSFEEGMYTGMRSSTALGWGSLENSTSAPEKSELTRRVLVTKGISGIKI